MISKKPDFKNANLKANEILVASDKIATFPVKVKAVVKEWTDIQIRTFLQAKEKNIDIEANCFAAQILMPEQVINELKKRGAFIDKRFLMNKFGVSEEAAEKRLETLGKYNPEWKSCLLT